MGIFDFLEKIPILGRAIVKPAREILAPIAQKVGDFVAPVWDTAKTVAGFVPGASQLMEGAEALAKDFVGGAKKDIDEASDEVEQSGQRVVSEVGRGVQRLRDRGNRFVDRTTGQWEKMKQLGRDFATTVRDPHSWKQQYKPPEEDDDEEEPPRRPPPRRARRARRRRYDDED
jgi:hypothetical protein